MQTKSQTEKTLAFLKNRGMVDVCEPQTQAVVDDELSFPPVLFKTSLLGFQGEATSANAASV